MAATVDSLVAAFQTEFESNTHTEYAETRDPETNDVTSVSESTANNEMSSEIEDMIRPIFAALLAVLAEEGIILGDSTASRLDVG